MLTTRENTDLMSPRKNRWQAIPHDALMLKITSAAGNRGCQLSNGTIAKSNDGLRMAADWSIQGKSLKQPPEGAFWTFGVTNSNIQGGTNGRAAVYLYAGLDFAHRGSIVLAKRKVGEHRGGVNFAQRIKEALAWFAVETGPMRTRWDKLSKIPIPIEWANTALVMAGTMNLLARSRTYDAMNAFAKAEKQTMATLLLCFGNETKRSPPLYQMEYLWKFFNLISPQLKEIRK